MLEQFVSQLRNTAAKVAGVVTDENAPVNTAAVKPVEERKEAHAWTPQTVSRIQSTILSRLSERSLPTELVGLDDLYQ